MIFGWEMPASWLQAVQPIFVILLAPVMAWLWVRLGNREPSSPAKFALALLFAGLAFLLLVPAASLAQSGEGVRVSPLWLVLAYAIEELPPRLVGRMMGVFFLSNWLGNLLAGWTAGFFSSMPLPTLFGVVAGVSLGAAAIMFVLLKPIRNLMGGVH